MFEAFKLSSLAEGESAFVTEVHAGPAMDCRLTDLGLVRGTRVTCVLQSPAGDPRAYLIRGAVIALRKADADGVALERRAEAVPAGAVAT